MEIKKGRKIKIVSEKELLEQYEKLNGRNINNSIEDEKYPSDLVLPKEFTGAEKWWLFKN